MKAIAQNEIIALISDLNAFADRAEQMINAAKQDYERGKGALQMRQQSELKNLDASFQQNRDSVSARMRRTIQDARNILGEMDRMDERLCRADKYYVRTKTQKEARLAETTSERYADTTDYFSAMERIREDFRRISKKYSEDILPGLLNGLNYFFSNKRKSEYEELIVLRNTVASFVHEIEVTMPSLAEENVTGLREDYLGRKGAAAERHRREAAAQEAQYSAALETVADRIYTELDDILPDEFVDYLAEIVSRYAANVLKVNVTQEVQDEVLDMIFVDYPVDELVQSPVVASVIKQKCAALLSGSDIRFPVIMSTCDAPAWIIQGDHSDESFVQGFANSVMFGVLSACPVARLTFRVVDPENRGNSIAPFFDAKKKLPDLFGESILVNPEEISAGISRINEKVTYTLQNKLGNQYQNIFDYARAHPEDPVSADLLMLYDFPKGFDERSLDELRNILRHGSRCGIYVLISFGDMDDSGRGRDFQQSIQSILELGVTMQQSQFGFLYRGLPIAYYPMPDRAEFARFFSKYMLIYEGICHRGIAFPPLVRKLIDSADSAELEQNIEALQRFDSAFERRYGKVPLLETGFPSLVTLGSVFYPADIFSDSPGFQRIMESFGVELYAGPERNQYVLLPLTFDMGQSFHLFLECPENAREAMLDFSHHVIWTFLSTFPVTKVNVCIFDAEQRGNSAVPFLDFRKKCPETFDQRIYTSQEDMTEKLRKLNEQIDEFIQEKLGNRYQNILEYNVNTPKRAEPVTLLVLYDFPSGMDGRSLDMLMNILRNGNKCGVYTVICHNPGVVYSRYDSIEERMTQIQRYCTAVDFQDERYRLLPYNLLLNIPPTPFGSAADSFISSYAAAAEAQKKKGLSFRDILSSRLFSMDSTKSLRIPVGVGDGDAIVSVTLGEGSSHHGLIAGATGSGKSTLLHTLIMSGMLNYSPEQLHLYLMDFKSGTEFKIYESVKLPHIQLLALDAMQEFGESILENLVTEMERRGSLFKSAGQTSLKGYKEATGNVLPRILVIMDEFQILYNMSSNRKVAMNCAELTKRIVTEGRAFGIHLLMATQSTKVISDLTLSSGTIEQMRIRIGMKCGESDARYLFGDNDEKALNMMKGPIGTAVMNPDYTEKDNIGFRAAYCDGKTQRELLEQISTTYAGMPSNLQIFEGGRTTALIEYFRNAGISLTEEAPVRIHMGTLIKVAPPFAITVDRKRKHNMLICGANERMANTVANNYMISALMNRGATVYCADGDVLVGDGGSEAFYDAMEAASSRFRAARNRGDVIRFIRDLYSDYQGWKKQNGTQTVFFVIKNLQFIDILQSMFKGEPVDESDYVEETPPETPPADPANPFAAVTTYFANRSTAVDSLSAGEKLLKLIADGSGYGIHFIVTSLEFQTVRECMYYADGLLNRFPERVMFSLGDNEAGLLAENASTAGLRENTVFFTDGVKNFFQMKPYTSPSLGELQEFLAGLE